jgi:P-type conjugative transfer protein TrbJ
MSSHYRLSRTRKYLTATLLGLGTAGSLVMAISVPSTPAGAQISVFDPTNYSQNLLTAARTLTQITNQIQSLQNEATMLINQAKNLSRIDFPELQQLTQNLQTIDRLMAQARGIDFRIDGLDRQFSQLFPKDLSQALTSNQRVVAARERLDTAMAGFRQTMDVQSQVVANVQADAGHLSAIVAKSQGADGALQVSQASNQLLALVAKQQFQIQDLMAAQYRAEATEAARRAQAEAEGRAAIRKFLGTGSAYTPQ